MFDDKEFNSKANDDINKRLLSDTSTILSDELKRDTSTAISESTLTNIQQENNMIESNKTDAQWFEEYTRRLMATTSPIIFEYHKSEIELVNKIITSILSIAKGISFATVALVAICILCDKDTGAIISGAIGGIIDIILGVLAGLFNSTLKSKKSYFDSEIDSSKFSSMMLLVQTISDKKNKDDIIVKILRSYFKIPKD